MVFEGDLTVKLHANDYEVGANSDRSHEQDQVTIGRVHSPESPNDESLCFFRIQYHEVVIAPLLNNSLVPVKGGSNSRSACKLANNCQ